MPIAVQLLFTIAGYLDCKLHPTVTPERHMMYHVIGFFFLCPCENKFHTNNRYTILCETTKEGCNMVVITNKVV